VPGPRCFELFVCLRNYPEHGAAPIWGIAGQVPAQGRVAIQSGLAQVEQPRLWIFTVRSAEAMKHFLSALGSKFKDRAQIVAAPVDCSAVQIGAGIRRQAPCGIGSVVRGTFERVNYSLSPGWAELENHSATGGSVIAAGRVPARKCRPVQIAILVEQEL